MSPERRRERSAAASSSAKAELRVQVGLVRASQDPAQRLTDDEVRCDLVLAALGGQPPAVVALYHSIGHEPSTDSLIKALHAEGVALLLPVLSRLENGNPRREPDWAYYEGPDALRDGLWGIREPTGPTLGPGGLALAGLVLMPGIAASRTGHRLGTGGGWYDRALDHAGQDVPRWLLLNDAEVLDEVPTDPWDKSVDAIITQSAVISIVRPDVTPL